MRGAITRAAWPRGGFLQIVAGPSLLWGSGLATSVRASGACSDDVSAAQPTGCPHRDPRGRSRATMRTFQVAVRAHVAGHTTIHSRKLDLLGRRVRSSD